jgi:hypothetical protein
VVRDNGQGFYPECAPGAEDGHYGITGMRERAARIGADIQLASGPSGTCISLRVPVPRPRSVARGYVLSVFRRTLHRLSALRLTRTRPSEQLDAKANSRFDLG